MTRQGRVIYCAAFDMSSSGLISHASQIFEMSLSAHSFSSATRCLTYVSPLPIVFASSLPDILWIPISDLMALLTCRPNGLTSSFLLPTSFIIARNYADMRASETKYACFDLTVRAIARIMWSVKEET